MRSPDVTGVTIPAVGFTFKLLKNVVFVVCMDQLVFQLMLRVFSRYYCTTVLSDFPRLWGVSTCQDYLATVVSRKTQRKNLFN